MERVIESDEQRRLLIRYLGEQPLPLTIKIIKGKHRTVEQNRLQRMWCNEVSEQLGDRTPEEVRGYCKLTIGVPMLRAENEKFRQQYDRVVRPLPYEMKLAIMQEPLDLPVTRLMTTEQKTRYLDQTYKHWVERGIELTIPEEQRGVA